MKQIFFQFINDYKKEHGGTLNAGKRKTTRPLSTKHPTHLVLKSTRFSFFNPSQWKIEKLIRQQAQKWNIRIYDLALNWSHIHLLVQLPSRQDYNSFIRTVTAEMVQLLSLVTGKDLTGLFDLRPYTRIISWGREFNHVREYIMKNQMEARGCFQRPSPRARIRLRIRPRQKRGPGLRAHLRRRTPFPADTSTAL